MSDILRQVDEDLRKEKITVIWKRYRAYVISFVLIVTLSTIGYQITKEYQTNYNEKLVEEYLYLSNSSNIDETIYKLEKIYTSDHTFVAGLAKLKAINLLAMQNKREESNQLLMDIIENKNYDSIIVDFAKYLYVTYNIETLDIDEMNKLLSMEAINQSKFKYLFLEILALKYLIESNFDLSNNLFNKILDEKKVSSEIKSRSEKFLEIIKNNE